MISNYFFCFSLQINNNESQFTVLIIVGTISIMESFATSRDCNYNWGESFIASECCINKASYKGYKCHCWYKGAWRCSGINKTYLS